MRAEVLRRDAAGDRVELVGRDGALERRRDRGRVELLAAEVALHQRVVGLDDGVEQLLAVLGGDARPSRPGSAPGRPRARRPDPCRRSCGAGRRRRSARARCRSAAGSRRSGRRAAPGARRACGRSRRARGRACSRRRRARARAPRRGPTTRAVFTSTPITPETTTSAPSTTRRLAIVSAWKPESPGVSIRLIFRPCHSRCASDAESDICRLLLVLVPVGDRRARLDGAEAVDRARLEEHRLHE